MSQKTRQILYILFLIAFFIITPMVMLYAMGYSLKLTWPLRLNQALQKTGMLIIDSEPQGARIYLNDKLQRTSILQKYFPDSGSEITTPAKIKNLPPGDYSLRLELEGYWSWTKKLTVNPGGGTFAENISLFRNNLPTLIFQQDDGSSISSSDDNYFFISGNGKLSILNKKDETYLSTTTEKSQTTENIHKSPNDKYVYANNVIYETRSLSKKIDLSKSIGNDINNIRWDKDSDEKIYYQQGNKIFSFDIETQINKNLKSNNATTTDGGKILDYLIKNNNLYTIRQQADKKCRLNILSLSDYLDKNLNIPGADDYAFVDYDNEYINILNKSKKDLYVIDEANASAPLQMTINNINIGQWINKDKFLYANDFELWLIDLKNDKRRLLTRISQEIEHILWHPNDNYAIYSTNDSINIIELDEREKHNITEITKLEKIGKIYLNSKGDLLYFEGKINNQEGLYKLAIQ